MEIASFLFSIVALILAALSAGYAGLQVKAARQQVEAAYEALKQSERYRLEDRSDAQPNFAVSADP
jgi:Tfp pilus assembly protein PilV